MTSGELDLLLQQAVLAGDAPGVVAMAADAQGVIYAGAAGTRVIDGEASMTLDTVFWLASMTKAVTSVAALQLVEAGALSLDAPLHETLPELRDIQVLEGFDDAGQPRLRPPRRPVTLRHLLTHTAGFSYDIWNADMRRYLEYTGTPAIGQCKKVSLMAPLVFDPGERWEYGINIDWVGQTVERVSGKSLEKYFKEHLFGPLQMPDTGFVLGDSQRQRLATVHRRQPDGSLQPTRFEVTQNPEFYMGGGGLYSTGTDYLRFLRMLLNQGELDGARTLKPETVLECNRNQIGELAVRPLRSALPESSNDAEFFPGLPKKWGLAYMINAEDAPLRRSAGSLAWAGLANTYYWIDPRRQLAGLILTQVLPFADPRVLLVFEQFECAIYAARA